MRRSQVWSSLALLILLLTPRGSHAQFFGPPVRTLFLRLERTPSDRFERLRIGTYWTQWELPSYRTAGATVRRSPNPGLLMTADYFLTDDLSLGGWWNRITGDENQRGRMDLPRHIAGFEAFFWDVHLTYYLPASRADGWTVQVGYSTLHFDVELEQQLGGANVAGTGRSINLWIARTVQVGVRSAGGHRHPIYLFGSIGYIPSPLFGMSNVIIGGSLDLSSRLSCTGSVWFNDLENLSLRVTVGLVGTF